MFPTEIWEIIFFYTDPISLVRLREVSKLWKAIIDNVFKEKDHWYEQCKKDIPKCFWSSFNEKFTPTNIETDSCEIKDSKTWMAMYKSWMICKNVTRCNLDIKSFNPLPKYPPTQRITCFNALSDLLAIGTSNGYVYVYDLHCIDGPPVFTGDHLEFIQSIQFLKYGDSLTVASCSINSHVIVWDIEVKKVVRKKRGRIVGGNYFHMCIAMDNLFSIVGSAYDTMYHYASNHIMFAKFDDDMVSLYTQNGHNETYLTDALEEIHRDGYLRPPALRVRRFYAFKPDIFAYMTELGLLGFSIEGKDWKEYNVYGDLQSRPTAMTIHANLLILGLESGNVHMYSIKDLNEFDFNAANSKSISLDSFPIISVEIYMQAGEQCLAVAQMHKIHLIKFI